MTQKLLSWLFAAVILVMTLSSIYPSIFFAALGLLWLHCDKAVSSSGEKSAWYL
ncbi:hypothetical protein ACVC7V_21695 [Hydrogenophaga sp. A37]|uniref:hypothetical protein n=1 Tax=Hydrogenophaga sp. A37 TaxID=1945864 RepID=UPI0015C57A53|nr:hypothetical protein [Hydrogenophaga sp. A37]